MQALEARSSYTPQKWPIKPTLRSTHGEPHTRDLTASSQRQRDPSLTPCGPWGALQNPPPHRAGRFARRPIRATRALSSAARAAPLHGDGRGFESLIAHHTVARLFTIGLVAQLVRAPPCHGGGRGFKSHPGRQVILAYPPSLTVGALFLCVRESPA